MAELFPVEVQGLRFERSGAVLLDVPTLAFQAGQHVGLVGPNGAGKSLLLRAITGLLGPSQSGAVRWGGRSIGPDVVSRCGVVMQQPIMLRRSVRDNLTLVIARHMRRDQVADCVEHALQCSGLQDQAGRSARVLSGGERMRLAVTRALALSPDMLMLDEPTANLDHSAARQIEQLVRDSAQAGTTLLLISHDLALVRRLCDRVILMHRGRVVADARTADFFASPDNSMPTAFVRGEYLD